MSADQPKQREEPDLIDDEGIDYSDIPELSDDAVLVWRGPIQGYLELLRMERKQKSTH